ncbi:hypothetical protein KIL84_004496 [Mauremys mutica]|uniref:Uncharacterized protein n=1 Tax=Mauremys mutica TaxID=74926 RepID=A0A9D3XLV4_9SAUR|nr:hypothetical protein KIL84_004496 [Mauremys mutica]
MKGAAPPLTDPICPGGICPGCSQGPGSTDPGEFHLQTTSQTNPANTPPGWSSRLIIGNSSPAGASATRSPVSVSVRPGETQQLLPGGGRRDSPAGTGSAGPTEQEPESESGSSGHQAAPAKAPNGAGTRV